MNDREVFEVIKLEGQDIRFLRFWRVENVSFRYNTTLHLFYQIQVQRQISQEALRIERVYNSHWRLLKGSDLSVTPPEVQLFRRTTSYVQGKCQMENPMYTWKWS